MALLGLNSLTATGTNQGLSISPTGTGVVNIPATLDITRYGNTHFQLGANYDTYLTYGSTGAVYLRTYNGTSYVNRFVIDANGRLTTGLVPWARLEDVPSTLSGTINTSGNQTKTGVLTLQGAGQDRLIIRNTTNGEFAGINFSDHSSAAYGQNGTIKYAHVDTSSYGSAAAFFFEGTEGSHSYVFGPGAKILPSVNNTGVIGDATYTWANGRFTNLTVATALTLGAQASVTTSAVRADRSLTIAGTTNQVTVSLTGAQDLTANRSWTLSLPQNIHTAATPTFGALTVNGNLGIRAATTTSAATQIPVFIADPTSTTRILVTRTPAQLLGDIGVNNATLTLATSGIATGSQTWTSNQATNATFTVNVPGTDLGITQGTTAGPIVTSSTGTNVTLPTASGTASGVVTTGAQTWAGVKTFNSVITGSISGNAGTSTTLQTAREINGTSFNGSANITTANWGTARNLTIGNSTVSVNGSTNYSWSLANIGAVDKSGDTMTGFLTLHADPTSNLHATTKQYVDGILAANDAMIFKGTLGTGGTYTTLPTTHGVGWTIRVITAGTYAGQVAEVGDMYVSLVTRSNLGNVNADWTLLQTNIDGAVVGPASATDNHVALFNGTSGKVIKSAGAVLGSGTLTLATSGIATGSQTFGANQNTNATFTVNVPATNLGITAGTTAGPIVTSSTGNNATLPTASATASGVVTTAAQTWAGVKTFNNTITGSISGNAGTATTWATGRTIALTGDVTGTSVAFNGSANLSFATTLANSGVTASTYRSVTVDVKGRVTAGTNPTTVAGYGITDAVTTSGNQTIAGVKTFSGTTIYSLLTGPATQTRDKIRVWSGAPYSIGMKNGYTYGPITGSDYAMSFQMNNSPSRGFWWGHDAQTDAQGAMALSTDGKLTIAHSVRIGYGESDVTVPGVTHRLDISGSANITSTLSLGTQASTTSHAVRADRSLTITGTTNQVTVSLAGAQNLTADRSWTLSLPQNIHTAATPTFGGLTINGNLGIRAATTTSAATQIPVFTEDPASTTRTLVTRTPAQFRGDISAAVTNQTMHIGTTAVAINRASAAQTLTGVSIDGNAATVTNGVYTSGNQTIAGLKTFSNPELRIGSSNTENYISFRGTTGDAPGSFNHTYIGEYLYGGTESSELLLFKGNDVEGPSGPDRIRLIGANHVFQTYNSAFSGTFTAIASSAVPITRLIIRQNGNVGIGTIDPSELLHVNGKIHIGTQATATTDAVRADRSISTGNGLTGGGNLTANRTLSVQVVSGGGISAISTGISVDSTVVRTSSLTTQVKTIGIGDARLTADFSGSTGADNYMPTPAQFNDKAFTPIFTQDWPQTSSWAGILTTKGWSGSTYAAWQLAGTSHTSAVDEWYLRTGLNTTWNAWRRIWHNGNSNPVNLSGNQTISGIKTFNNNIFLANNTSLRQTSTSTWSGDPGSGVGKIEYHSNRWYIVAGSNSTELVRFRQDGSDKSYIDNDGVYVGNVNGSATSVPWSGISGQRTLSRDNAGLQGDAGARSGFFETSAPVNYYSGASSWQHLIESRHTNDGNNFAMQIAGSFFDQLFYVRKTNNSATTAWLQLITSGGDQTIGGTKTFSSRLIVTNTFNVNGSGAGGQSNGLYLADLGSTAGTTLNPTFTVAIAAQINSSRSIALSVDSSGYIWGFRSHSDAGTYTFQSKSKFADQWTTGRTIALTGDVTGTSTAFNGSANLSFATTLANSGVTAGTYRSVTVDAKGRVTAGTNPTTVAGYGITDAVTTSGNQTISGTKTFNGLIDAFGSTGAINVNNAGTRKLEVRCDGTNNSAGNAAYMTFHRPNAFAVRFGLDTNNRMRVGGWSLGNIAYDVILGDSFANPSTVGITATNQLLLKNGTDSNVTTIVRNDAFDFYFLLSNASTGLNGTWNTLRPFKINLTSGLLSSENGQTFGGGTTITGTLSLGTQASTTSHAVRADRSISTGDGLTGGGNLTANRELAVNNSVVRTFGEQNIGGAKTFANAATFDGNVNFPGATTTANAANAFLNSGSSPANRIFRSTSSLRYKTEIEDIEQERFLGVLNLRPVWYRSLSEVDRSDWSWYGLIAEEVAEIEPRLVHWTYSEDSYEEIDGEQKLKADANLIPDGVQYERVTVLLLDVVKLQQKRIEALESKMAALETQ
jgi:hypothetical protein